jgi:hypothetical protein
MKVPLKLPHDLYRRAKAAATLRGRRVNDLIAEGLRLVLGTRRKKRGRPSLAELMKRASGIAASGVPDLASNPEHLTGFGRDIRRQR